MRTTTAFESRRGDVDAVPSPLIAIPSGSRGARPVVQPLGRLGDAAGRVRRLGQRAAGWVAVEDGDGVAEERADVDVLAVGADDDHVGAVAARARRAAGQRRAGDAAGRRELAQGAVEGLRRKRVTASLAREVA